MERRIITRRGLLHWAVVASAGTALAACAPKTIEVEKTVEKTVVVKETVLAPTTVGEVAEITYFDIDESGFGEDAFKVYTDQVVAPFNEQNPNIKVNFQAGTDDWPQTIMAGMAAGNAPDIFLHYTDFGQELMQGGQTLPLQEHFQPDDLADFYESQLVAMRIGPSLFALPKYISAMTLAYNKDMLDEAGVAYPDGTWDWTDLANALEKVSKLGPNELGQRWGFSVNIPYHQHWVWMNGGEWMNKEFLGTKCLIGEPKGVEAEQFVHDMIWKYGYAPKAADIEGLGWPSTFQTGRFAFQDAFSWGVSDFVRNCQFRWDLTIIKGPAGKGSQCGSDAYSIWAKTKHPEAAASFLRYLTSVEVERTMMLSVHGWHPSRKSLQQAWSTESEAAKAGINVKALSDVMQFARQIPYFYDHAKVYEILNPLWDQIWVTGELPLAAGLQQITNLVNEYLASVV
ncbi:MAG: ABC transporter substrate-binding protein [Anaerolineae bacterium]